MKKVILIGDSIRGGYSEVVRWELAGAATVWSPDQSGGKSSDLLHNLQEWVLSKQPDVLHFGMVVNDLFALVHERGREKLLLSDGVHFASEGYEILGQQVVAVIRANLVKN